MNIEPYFSRRSCLLHIEQAFLNSHGNILWTLFFSVTLANNDSAACLMLYSLLFAIFVCRYSTLRFRMAGWKLQVVFVSVVLLCINASRESELKSEKATKGKVGLKKL